MGKRAPWRCRCVLPVVITTAALGGCTLIRVASLVGKQFAPALGEGDKAKLQTYSTRRLARYWAAFSEKEIRAAVGADGPPPRDGHKRRARRKRPSIHLVSFHRHGDRAVLRVRRGKERYAFTCLWERGAWRVDDVAFVRQGKRSRLSEMLQVLVAAKTLQRGLERGSRGLLESVATPVFRSRVLARISDADLRSLADSGLSSTRRSEPKRSRRKRARIRTQIDGDRATVTLSGASLPIAIHLLRRGGGFRVDRVRLRLGGHWHQLGDLLEYLGPALRLVHWFATHVVRAGAPMPPSPGALGELVSDLRGFLSGSLWRRTFSWLRARDLAHVPWSSLRSLLGGPGGADGKRGSDARSAAGGSSFHPRDVVRLERRGDQLTIRLRLTRKGTSAARQAAPPRATRAGGRTLAVEVGLVREGGIWRLSGGWVQLGGPASVRLSIAALLSTVGGVARVAALAYGLAHPSDRTGETEGVPARLRALMRAIRGISTRRLNRRLWSRFPDGLLANLPLEWLLARFVSVRRAPARGAERTRMPASPRSTVAGARVQVRTGGIVAGLRVAGRLVRVRLLLQDGAYRLDDIQATIGGAGRSLQETAPLLLPGLQLANALLSKAPRSLEQAFARPLRRKMVAPFVRILGVRRTRDLLAFLRGLLQTRLEQSSPGHAPSASPSRPAALPSRTDLRLTHDPAAGTAHLWIPLAPGASASLSLTRESDGAYRIADLRFPLAGRSWSLLRVGPVLAPVAGFALALLDADLPALRRASGRVFRRRVWRRMRPRTLRRLVRKLAGGRSLPRLRGPGASSKAPHRAKPPHHPARARRARSRPPVRLLSLRIRDKARWPWAEIELSLGSKRLVISLAQERGAWRIHDVKVTLGGLLLSVRQILAAGL